MDSPYNRAPKGSKKERTYYDRLSEVRKNLSEYDNKMEEFMKYKATTRRPNATDKDLKNLTTVIKGYHFSSGKAKKSTEVEAKSRSDEVKEMKS